MKRMRTYTGNCINGSRSTTIATAPFRGEGCCDRIKASRKRPTVQMSILTAWQRLSRPNVRVLCHILPHGFDFDVTKLPKEDGAGVNFKNAPELCAHVDRFVAHLDMQLIRGGAAQLAAGSITVSVRGAPHPARRGYNQRWVTVFLDQTHPTTYASKPEAAKPEAMAVVFTVDLGPQPMEVSAAVEEMLVAAYDRNEKVKFGCF